MPTIPLRAILAGLAALALLFGAFASGVRIEAWRKDAVIADLNDKHMAELQAISDEVARAEEANRRQEETWRAKLAGIDQKHFEEMQNANELLQQYRTSLRAGDKRVFVRAKCAAGGSVVPGAAAAPGVDHAEARAELSPEVAEQLGGIAGDGDSAIRQLTALQDYVRAILAPADSGTIQVPQPKE
ncbi:MAG TPA: lysis system i-spanin subunit Rz [Noviherbaspirillum sp.]|nr:lysis system i-spanin subunit Rz [Noviherbaspirillum sp.]